MHDFNKNIDKTKEKGDSLKDDLSSLMHIMNTFVEEISEDLTLIQQPDIINTYINLYKKTKFIQEATEYTQFALPAEDKLIIKDICFNMITVLLQTAGIEQEELENYLQEKKMMRIADKAVDIAAWEIGANCEIDSKYLDNKEQIQENFASYISDLNVSAHEIVAAYDEEKRLKTQMMGPLLKEENMFSSSGHASNRLTEEEILEKAGYTIKKPGKGFCY